MTICYCDPEPPCILESGKDFILFFSLLLQPCYYLAFFSKDDGSISAMGGLCFSNKAEKDGQKKQKWNLILEELPAGAVAEDI